MTEINIEGVKAFAQKVQELLTIYYSGIFYNELNAAQVRHTVIGTIPGLVANLLILADEVGISRDRLPVPNTYWRLRARAEVAEAALAKMQIEVAQLQEKSAWHPIATAPRDGRFIIVWDPYIKTSIDVLWENEAWHDSWTGQHVFMAETITHWREPYTGPDVETE